MHDWGGAGWEAVCVTGRVQDGEAVCVIGGVQGGEAVCVKGGGRSVERQVRGIAVCGGGGVLQGCS